MNMALITGAGFGFGLLLIWRGLHPAPVSLAASIDRLSGEGIAEIKAVNSGSFSSFGPLGRCLLGLAESLGLSLSKLRRDLAVLDRPIETHFAEKTALFVFGIVSVPAVGYLMILGGVPLPLSLPVWAGLAFGSVLFFAPDIGIGSDAVKRRDDFRHALSSFLDLVVVSIAGGAGVESALSDAAAAGNGWALLRIRRCLDEANVRHETPWIALGRLGNTLGVDELIELSASVGLAGTEGAKVRQSLAAKTVSLRTHQLTSAEAKAQSSTEAMSIPVVLLFAGFLVFISFPAISNVLTKL